MDYWKKLASILALGATFGLASGCEKETFPDCICKESREWCAEAICTAEAQKLQRNLYLHVPVKGTLCTCACEEEAFPTDYDVIAIGPLGEYNCDSFRERISHAAKEKRPSGETFTEVYAHCLINSSSGEPNLIGACFTGGGGGGGGDCGGDDAFVCCGGLCCHVGSCASDNRCYDNAGGVLVCGYDCNTLEMRCVE